MQVIVHYPKSKEAVRIMEQKVAEVHAQSIMNQIYKMHLSKENSESLIKVMCEKLK